MFKIKTRYYLELLTPEAMKLLGSTKSETTKKKNGVKVPHQEITEVELIHRNIISKIMSRIHDVLELSLKKESYIHLFLKTFW